MLHSRGKNVAGAWHIVGSIIAKPITAVLTGRLIGLLARRTQARAGIAAVEFALLAPVIAGAMALMVDFANAYYVKLCVVSATNAAAQFAFLNGQNVAASTVASFLSNAAAVAQSAAGLSASPTVTILFNNAPNSSNAGQFYCLSGYAPTTWTSTGTSSASCGGNVMSGKFVSIAVAASANSLWNLDPLTELAVAVTDYAVVRVQ